MSRYLQIVVIFCVVFVAAKAQDLGPEVFVGAEPLPTALVTDSIHLTDSVFGTLSVPFHGKVISKFGRRGSRMHTGTDVKLLKGDEVKCAFDGIVDIASAHYGYGLLVTVKHAHNVTTYYSHLSKILVKKGEPVKSGQVIGLGGATGRATTTHLHFELRLAGKPLNPQEYIDFENNQFLATTIVPPAVKMPSTSTTATAVKSPAAANSHTVQAQTSTTSSTTDSVISHVVSRGDTLYALAKRYGTTVMQLCSLNGITTKTVLKIGSVLKIQ